MIDNNDRGDVSQSNGSRSIASQAICNSSKYSSSDIEREHVTDKSGGRSEASGSDDTPVAKEMESQKNEACDLFEGKWVKDERGSPYTSTTCPTLPDSKNCGKYGKDQGFVYWRWKPEGCELPRFDARMFLRVVRGKKLMFVGDSLARNMMESLLCLLSQVSY
ncbi:protein ALTERED XYLOGLUCAN 4-like [Asparagus officinalis]|nr:protein ALTERED XYLOGLUCAN 4-like [Asparagus officinalis]